MAATSAICSRATAAEATARLNRRRPDRIPRPLQHLHSKDDLDALRPCKTRRTGPSFDQDENQNVQDRSSAQDFLVGGNGDAVYGSVGAYREYLYTPEDGSRMRMDSSSRPGGESSAGNAGGGDILGVGGLGLTTHAMFRMERVNKREPRLNLKTFFGLHNLSRSRTERRSHGRGASLF